MGGAVTYTNESKTKVLGVPAELIAEHGAVSPEVAEAMADGALDRVRRGHRRRHHRNRGADGRHRGEARRLRLRLREERRRAEDRPRPRHARNARRRPRALGAPRHAPHPAPAPGRGLPALVLGEAVRLRDRGRRGGSSTTSASASSGHAGPKATDVGWEYGMDQGFLRRLCEHWASDYDWRATESRLNEFDNGTWEGIHFIRAGEGPDRRSCSSTAGRARCSSSSA